jgi:hypothetical protein
VSGLLVPASFLRGALYRHPGGWGAAYFDLQARAALDGARRFDVAFLVERWGWTRKRARYFLEELKAVGFVRPVGEKDTGTSRFGSMEWELTETWTALNEGHLVPNGGSPAEHVAERPRIEREGPGATTGATERATETPHETCVPSTAGATVGATTGATGDAVRARAEKGARDASARRAHVRESAPAPGEDLLLSLSPACEVSVSPDDKSSSDTAVRTRRTVKRRKQKLEEEDEDAPHPSTNRMMELLIHHGALTDGQGQPVVRGHAWGKQAVVLKRMLRDADVGEERLEKAITVGMRRLYKFALRGTYRAPFTAFDVQRHVVEAIAAAEGEAPPDPAPQASRRFTPAGVVIPADPEIESRRRRAVEEETAERAKKRAALESAQVRYQAWADATAEAFRNLPRGEKARFADAATAQWRQQIGAEAWERIPATRQQQMIGRLVLANFASERGLPPPPDK